MGFNSGFKGLKKRTNLLGGKNGSTEHSKGNKKQYHEKWLHHLKRMDTNRIQNKHYNISQKDEET